MTTDAHPDVRPGTIPPWALRVAYDGEEWLVLMDVDQQVAASKCAQGFGGHWARYTVAVEVALPLDCGCVAGGGRDEWSGDDLAEAHAAFDRIEAEWRARHDDEG